MRDIDSAGGVAGGYIGGDPSGATSSPPGASPAPLDKSPFLAAPAAGKGDDEIARANAIADTLSHYPISEAAKRLGWSEITTRRKLRAMQRDGIAALLRRARADRGCPRVADDETIRRVQREYLHPHRPTARSIYRRLATDCHRSGVEAPSYSFVLRAIRRIDPDLIARYRYGERRYDDRYAYVTLRRKPARPRQWCDADHHPCDHAVVFADGSIGRPWLTAIQDIATNEILGIHLTRGKPVGKGTYPGAQAIGLCIRNAILRKSAEWPSYGLFDHLYADLGRDFRSEYVRAVCRDLGIAIVHTRGYHGKSKPIERWFGVMEDALRALPGYVGRRPEDNPQRQNLVPRPFNRDDLLTIEQFEQKLIDWIVCDFHHAPSSALEGLSPLEALRAHVDSGFVAREVRDERALDLLLMRKANKRVRNAGVQHFGRWYFAPELLSIIGRQVQVAWDPARVGELVIYLDNRFLCTARNRELVDYGASEETLRRERELKRQQRQELRRRYEELIRQRQYPSELARARAEEEESREKRQIAVGAEAPAATALLPKYARAIKALDRPPVRPARAAPRRIDDTPATEEMFHRVVNPWLEDE
jgi:putative transposase